MTTRIRERGPLTVAAFMDLALYEPGFGYYARAPRRSGRAGDFFTSVDVGPLFGELLAVQIAEMAAILGRPSSTPGFDLVEAGAGDGRLSADILRALRTDAPGVYDGLRLHLIEASPSSRTVQRDTLGGLAERLASRSDGLPHRFEGVLLANELLDAMPTHQVVMRGGDLREVYVDERDGQILAREGPPSSPALAEYLRRAGVALEEGWRAEISLAAIQWVRDAARRLTRGFIVLVDYGHEARELYSMTHSGGTLTTFAQHAASGPESREASPAWLAHPGERDITSHVDFTSVRRAAEEEGLTTLGFLDQTYFLMGLVAQAWSGRWSSHPAGDRFGAVSTRRHAQLKTLIMPGGLGSTMKVLILGKEVGTPSLLGCSYRMRVT